TFRFQWATVWVRPPLPVPENTPYFGFLLIEEAWNAAFFLWLVRGRVAGIQKKLQISECIGSKRLDGGPMGLYNK
ncbi:hypothetical protein, partial [uncultured Subdoligranulum sp.]|uniref:hypothetical protein n=1 Tax=uncultured Subdoligranulum sp. TaxID=512298 RepID=UPI00261249C7